MGFEKLPLSAPLRVDFAGGWLDVPKLAREDGYIVNCAISPLASLKNWPYEKCSGLGGSAAWALLNNLDPVQNEIANGVGWQDPAVIQETGLCVWESGQKPKLNGKHDFAFLKGKMALQWTNRTHNTPDLVDVTRDYDAIARASQLAKNAVEQQHIGYLAHAITQTYLAQRSEKMPPLPALQGSIAHKYCGSGHGGYALYLFGSTKERNMAVQTFGHMKEIEPFMRSQNE